MTTAGIAMSCGAVALAAASVAAIWWRRRLVLRAEWPKEEVETLKFGDVVAFFKQEDFQARFRANRDLLAVAIRKPLDGGAWEVSLCAFDQTTEKVAPEDFPEGRRYRAQKLDDALAQAFGDKDMLVVQ